MLAKKGIRIMCGKCSKEIDELRCVYDVVMDVKTYIAICHGEEETTSLTAMDMMIIHQIDGATAFVQPLALDKREGL